MKPKAVLFAFFAAAALAFAGVAGIVLTTNTAEAGLTDDCRAEAIEYTQTYEIPNHIALVMQGVMRDHSEVLSAFALNSGKAVDEQSFKDGLKTGITIWHTMQMMEERVSECIQRGGK